MKKIAVEQAVGMALCHDITGIWDGFKGVVFRRGHIITEADIPQLLDLGKKRIFVREERDEGLLHEDDCARRLSAMAPVAGAHYTEPSEGKVLLIADQPGMFRVDTPLLQKINSIGDITIATLTDHYPAECGSRLASMRIVPLMTEEEQIIRAESLCRHRRLLDLRPYRNKTAGLIITGSEIYKGRIRDKFAPVLREKLSRYPCHVLDAVVCDDDPGMIVNAAKAHLEQGVDFLIFTGGLSVDPDDLTPSAIRLLGADILTHGVPAQPGNMTLVAYLGDIPILGIPGAAIHLPTTIFDVLLPQIFTGDRLSREELMRLGDGGLCQMCAHCHFPNCTFGKY